MEKDNLFNDTNSKVNLGSNVITAGKSQLGPQQSKKNSDEISIKSNLDSKTSYETEEHTSGNVSDKDGSKN